MEATSYGQVLQEGVSYDDTLSINDSCEASSPQEAIEAIINRTAEKTGSYLDIVEYDATGPFSNLMRRWEGYSPNAEIWDVYLRWVK